MRPALSFANAAGPGVLRIGAAGAGASVRPLWSSSRAVRAEPRRSPAPARAEAHVRVDEQPPFDVRHFIASSAHDRRSLAEVVAQILAPHAAQLPAQRSLARAEELVRFGAVWWKRPADRRIARATNPSAPVEVDAYVRVFAAPKRFPVDQVEWRARLVHEGDGFVVIDKPSGIPTHCTTDNLHENCASRVGELLGLSGPALVTTRLDQPTSGLLVLATQPAFAALFNEASRLNLVRKRYRARVEAGGGPGPPLGPMLHYMLKSERAPKVVRREAGREGAWQACRLTVLDVRAAGGGRLDVLLELGTGRSHQIRAQLAAEGYPVLADGVYGPPGTAGGAAPVHRWSAGAGDGFGLACCSLEWPQDLPAALERAAGCPQPGPPDDVPLHRFAL